MGSRVHLDFRDFVNTLRSTKKGIYASTQDPEIRLAIYRDVADSKTFLEPKGPDTGATAASLEAVRNGGNGVNGKAYTNPRTGKTHYAYSSIGPEGITISPIDEYDRDYGQYSMYNYTYAYDISYDDEVFKEISDIILDHIYKGE